MSEKSLKKKLTPEEYEWLYLNGIIAPWYLNKDQLVLYEMCCDKKKVVCNCHRRFGKDTTALTYAFERAMTEPIIIRYGGVSQLQCFDVLAVILEHIYYKAPHLKPKLKNPIEWPSGARMFLFGNKDQAECDKGRGSECDLVIASEYGFWRHQPSYMLKSVLGPQLADRNGSLIIVSTPPEDLTHPYIEEIAESEIKGNLFRWDVKDSLRSGSMSESRHKAIIERCGGTDSDAYKREYLLSLVANKSRLVIPEGQLEELYIGSQPRPEYFHWFMVCDLGLKDFFAALWGYVDFKEARLVIVKEFVANYLSTSEIAKECKRIEAELNTPIEFRRLGDSSDPQQLYDLSKDHGYAISGIVKRSKMNNQGFRESVLNGLRVAISQGKILMEPDVQNTRIQLKYGIWNEKRTDFERTEKLGHLDALMALAYMVDNADYSDNPYPIIPREAKEGTHFINPELKKSSHVNLKRLVGI
jgi:hypothetical protein